MSNILYYHILKKQKIKYGRFNFFYADYVYNFAGGYRLFQTRYSYRQIHF